jgi:trans-2,3-dihydro-3-hydroxyanthranilate isomerase
MRKLHYHLVDVFTHRPFGGNQLAVFTNGRGLSKELMQQIARELNFSETTFVLPAQDKGNDFWVRIFTPATEMPIAGHPTVGTAFVLALEQMIDCSGPAGKVLFEEGVGVIPITLELENGRPTLIKMQQPLPEFGPEFTDRAAIAAMLSIDVAGIEPNYPLQVVSCGVPFLYVPLRDLKTIQSIKFRYDVWEHNLKTFEAPQVFVFTQETQFETSTVHSRMFAPALGIAEDPATGVAGGPLGAYLVKHGLVKPEAHIVIISEQGLELGRPSFITIEIDQTAGQISEVHVGGQCVAIGEGYIQPTERQLPN